LLLFFKKQRLIYNSTFDTPNLGFQGHNEMANQVFASCLTNFVPYTEPYLSHLEMTFSITVFNLRRALIENEFISCDFQDPMIEIFFFI